MGSLSRQMPRLSFSRASLLGGAFAVLALLVAEPNHSVQGQGYFSYRSAHVVPVVGGAYRYVPAYRRRVLSVTPGNVRIQTPLFSLNIVGGYPLPVTRYPSFAYGTHSYHPRYGYSYRYTYSYPRHGIVLSDPAYVVPEYSYPVPVYPGPGHAPVPHGSTREVIPPVSSQDYSPSAQGGVPELTPTDPILSDPIVAAKPPAKATPGALAVTQAALVESAKRLQGSLAGRGEQGQIWIDFLGVSTIVDAENSVALGEELTVLNQRYQGVLQNPELANIRATPGFRETALHLEQWVNQSAEAQGGAPKAVVEETAEAADEAAKEDSADETEETEGDSDDAESDAPNPPAANVPIEELQLPPAEPTNV